MQKQCYNWKVQPQKKQEFLVVLKIFQQAPLSTFLLLSVTHSTHQGVFLLTSLLTCPFVLGVSIVCLFWVSFPVKYLAVEVYHLDSDVVNLI
jgi:hypothetical protein